MGGVVMTRFRDRKRLKPRLGPRERQGQFSSEAGTGRAGEANPPRRSRERKARAPKRLTISQGRANLYKKPIGLKANDRVDRQTTE